MNVLLQTIEETKAALDSVSEDKKPPLVISLVTLSKKLIDKVLCFKDVPERFETEILPALYSQIEAAEKRTEKAADDIMSATENIMAALAEIEGTGKDKVQKNVNALFEACNFQDLVAQHLKEIRLLSDDLAEDMQELNESMDSLGGNGSVNAQMPGRARKQTRPDAHLLNGPATDF